MNLSSVDLLKETSRQFPVVFMEEVRTSLAVFVATKICLLIFFLTLTMWFLCVCHQTITTVLSGDKNGKLLHEMYIFNMVCRNAHNSFILLQVYYDSLL